MSTDLTIRDPKTRTGAGVTENGRLRAITADQHIIATVSRDSKLAFEFHPPKFAVVAGEFPILYFKNTSTKNNFHVERFKVYWNGGDASPRDKVVQLRTYIKMLEPDGQVVTGQFGKDANVPHNLNIGSNLTADADFRFWDGVATLGNGFTYQGSAYTSTELGNQINCGFFAQGFSSWDYNGSLIIPPNAVLGISADAQQGAGEVIIVLVGYYLPIAGEY